MPVFEISRAKNDLDAAERLRGKKLFPLATLLMISYAGKGARKAYEETRYEVDLVTVAGAARIAINDALTGEFIGAGGIYESVAAPLVKWVEKYSEDLSDYPYTVHAQGWPNCWWEGEIMQDLLRAITIVPGNNQMEILTRAEKLVDDFSKRNLQLNRDTAHVFSAMGLVMLRLAWLQVAMGKLHKQELIWALNGGYSMVEGAHRYLPNESRLRAADKLIHAPPTRLIQPRVAEMVSVISAPLVWALGRFYQD